MIKGIIRLFGIFGTLLAPLFMMVAAVNGALLPLVCLGIVSLFAAFCLIMLEIYR